MEGSGIQLHSLRKARTIQVHISQNVYCSVSGKATFTKVPENSHFPLPRHQLSLLFLSELMPMLLSLLFTTRVTWHEENEHEKGNY